MSASSTRRPPTTLYLSSAAITTNGNVSTVEACFGAGRRTVTRVSTGLVGNSDTQILSGLEAGDVVVEPTVDGHHADHVGHDGHGAFPGGGGGGGFLGGAGSAPGSVAE